MQVERVAAKSFKKRKKMKVFVKGCESQSLGHITRRIDGTAAKHVPSFLVLLPILFFPLLPSLEEQEAGLNRMEGSGKRE